MNNPCYLKWKPTPKENTFSIFTSNFYEGEKVLVIVFFYCNMFNKYTLNVLILKGEAQNLFKNLKPEKDKKQVWRKLKKVPEPHRHQM